MLTLKLQDKTEAKQSFWTKRLNLLLLDESTAGHEEHTRQKSK